MNKLIEILEDPNKTLYSLLFGNPAITIKKMAKICFYGCLSIAILLFVIGSIRFLIAVDFDGYPSFNEVLAYTPEDYAYGLSKGYDWYVNGYMGKIQCKTSFYIALSSLLTIPLYAFGCLIEDVAAIKQKLYENKDN